MTLAVLILCVSGFEKWKKMDSEFFFHKIVFRKKKNVNLNVILFL